ncbi:MAG: MFS transporter [Promethearchaeota archaeon]
MCPDKNNVDSSINHSSSGKPSLSEFERDPITLKELLGYNMGALPGAFYVGFMGQIQAFYYKWMGLGWGFILIAQIIYAIWNVLNDPLFGMLQDRTKTKQGRYIPWIKWCAPLFTIAFILVFFPPQTWRLQEGGEQYQLPLFFWYLFSQILYDTFFTIVYLAHVALLPQMTMATKERTKVAVLHGILSLIGGLAAGGLPIYFLTDPNSQKIQEFQFFTIVFGVLALIPWAMVVKFVKERQEYIPETDTSFWQNMKAVFKNPSGRIYIIYDGVSVGILNILLTSITFIFEWCFGLNSYYLDKHPDWGFMNILPYVLILVIGGAAGAIVQIQIPKKRDIKTAIMVGLIFQAIGFFIAFLGVLSSQNAPASEYSLPNMLLISIGLGIALFGLTTDFIYHNPMRADTIDYDEVLTGERSEAVYAGVGCILSKPMISVALALVPIIISLYGLVPADPNDPVGSTLIVIKTFPEVILGVGIVAFLIPSIFAAIGALAWHWYPLNREKLDEIHEILQELHEKKRMERLDSKGKSKFVKK